MNPTTTIFFMKRCAAYGSNFLRLNLHNSITNILFIYIEENIFWSNKFCPVD